ncbi:MAG: hypothetical protein Q7T05_08730, partial [Dehalococcoidia bacterium]|nr:hypothetical protein [Dehalococcoidia bacterium]
MISIDERLYLLINGLVGRWPFVDRIVAFLVNDYFVVVVFSLLMLVFWFVGDTPGRRAHFQTAFLGTSIGVALTNVAVNLLNLFVVYRDRPFIQYPDAHLLFYRPHDSSFPANSVAVSFAFAMGIYLAHRKTGIFAFALASLFALTRVYSGVH